MSSVKQGLGGNWKQFGLQVLTVFAVGLTVDLFSSEAVAALHLRVPSSSQKGETKRLKNFHRTPKTTSPSATPRS